MTSDLDELEACQVTDADRKRLATRYRELGQPGTAEAIENGEMEDHPNLLMLARHRIEAERAAMREAAEMPADVRRLVIAAREVAFGDIRVLVGNDDDLDRAMRELDAASEVFADRVPWETEPEAADE